MKQAIGCPPHAASEITTVMIFHCHVVKESDPDSDGYDPQIVRGELNRKCQRETHQETDKEEEGFHLDICTSYL